jgi:energy-converting hydrogenase Eha subunit C
MLVTYVDTIYFLGGIATVVTPRPLELFADLSWLAGSLVCCCYGGL